MDVTVRFFLPAIHERPTGGNLYNRRLIGGLRRRLAVDVEVDTSVRAFDPPDSFSREVRVGVVDSLVLRETDDFLAWVDRLTVDRLVLLVHYLEFLDPDRAGRRAVRRERRYLSLFDGFVSTSRFVKRRLEEEGIPADRIYVIRPGLEEAFRKPVTYAPDHTARVLTVASFLPGKGLIGGAEVLASVSGTDWCWQIVGDDTLDPEYAGRLRRRIEQMPAGGRVDIVGPVEANEVLEYYDRSDLFFLPSQFETCSMVTMEAMARGRPVVAYDVGGIGELVDDGRTGFLVHRDDPQTAAKRIGSLMEDPARRVQMGKASRQASQAFPTWEEATERMHETLLKVSR